LTISFLVKFLVYLLTWPGLIVALLLGFWRLVYLVSRWLAFPGGLSIHMRSMENDIGKRIVGRLKRATDACVNASEVVVSDPSPLRTHRRAFHTAYVELQRQVPHVRMCVETLRLMRRDGTSDSHGRRGVRVTARMEGLLQSMEATLEAARHCVGSSTEGEFHPPSFTA
jgi:hypothetical protein